MYKQKPAIKKGFCIVGRLHVTNSIYCIGCFSTIKKAENYKLSVCIGDKKIIPFSEKLYEEVDYFLNVSKDTDRKRW